MRTFIVAKRQLAEDEDVVTLVPVHFILEAPDDADANEIKGMLDDSGESDFYGWNWREYRVIPDDEWEQGRWEVDPEKWAREEESAYRREDPQPPWPTGTTYAWLEQIPGIQRRISLRLPLGLRVALSRAADEASAPSLNSFCINILAKAVNYEGIEQFEAQQRKPGRPRKAEQSSQSK